eukprot:scaffold87735_cov29-Prasinocladus_malaysianus.AAC.1
MAGAMKAPKAMAGLAVILVLACASARSAQAVPSSFIHSNNQQRNLLQLELDFTDETFSTPDATTDSSETTTPEATVVEDTGETFTPESE